jgi:hypothetical protein
MSVLYQLYHQLFHAKTNTVFNQAPINFPKIAVEFYSFIWNL